MNISFSIFKNIGISILIFFCIFQSSSAFAEIDMDSKILELQSLLKNSTPDYKKSVFSYLISQINTRLLDNPNIKNIWEVIYFKSELKNLYSDISWWVANSLVWFSDSLMITFIHWENHTSKIQSLKDKIILSNNVFLFRSKQDLTLSEIQEITKNIKEINPKIIIFIDQEGWEIYRYIDFPSTLELQTILDSFFIQVRLQSMTSESQDIFRKLFDTQKLYYFPSLQQLWRSYDLISDTGSKKHFLECAAYIRMKSLKQAWINSYGLILDLDYGNPVISWYDRSFSSDIQNYKNFIDALTLSAEINEIIIYGKHYPGHWDGEIDSHKWILDISSFPEYTQKNLDLFDYFL